MAAASRSWETARIAFPCRVDVTNQVRRTSTGRVMRITENLFQGYATSPISKTRERGIRSLADS
jgi:hypothetical protein